MIGIDDPYVLFAYFGTILVAIVSVIYGLVRRNAALDLVTEEDRHWAREAQEVEDGL
ncbi:symporter small accessory protein [Thiorhodococcus mannitoliphagus]|uniref:symporter small accessory protein n=1 Tax=Thiorhodococcus mannitoliphagus TaxID=329406 RepID=UPI00143203EF|nr:symporter small accessory protein [Thiorhodococcus mannitoliphagus]